jgi:hypothetical protein
MYGIWDIKEQTFKTDAVLFDAVYWTFSTKEVADRCLIDTFNRHPELTGLWKIKELPQELINKKVIHG